MNAIVHNPYRIDGPSLISFSGGRSSAYMLRQTLDAWGGQLPADVHVAFANTGKEMPETLDFVQQCGERWGVHITWLEYRWEPGHHGFEIVSHNSASRNGEPFDMAIRARSMLPNPVTSYCSIDLKIRTFWRYATTVLGWKRWDSVIGLRFDERSRVSKQMARNDQHKDVWTTRMPMYEARITKRDVGAFWPQPDGFDLGLSSVNFKTPLGNCDLCFKKGAKTIAGIIRTMPARADWWANHEQGAIARGTMAKPEMALFRADRPSYSAMLQLSKDQGDILDDDSRPCACHD